MAVLMLREIMAWLAGPFAHLNEAKRVVVEYNVELGSLTGGHQARSRELLLPAEYGYVIPSDAPPIPVLSLRSWPLGRLDAQFATEPSDAELIHALRLGWEDYVRAPDPERDARVLFAQANAWGM